MVQNCANTYSLPHRFAWRSRNSPSVRCPVGQSQGAWKRVPLRGTLPRPLTSPCRYFAHSMSHFGKTEHSVCRAVLSRTAMGGTGWHLLPRRSSNLHAPRATLACPLSCRQSNLLPTAVLGAPLVGLTSDAPAKHPNTNCGSVVIGCFYSVTEICAV
jgi:hypothetical protein